MIHIIDLKFLGKPHTIAAYLVETQGGPVLIESGPYSTFDNLKKGVEDIGFDIKDIQHVLLTHIHLDHAGAAWALAQNGATIYVHPNGARHLADPSKLYESAKRIYGDDMDHLWGDLKPIPKSQIQAVEYKKKVKVGKTKFKSLHTPGHANHHTAWQLNNELFSGDVAGIRIQNGVVLPPCPPPDIDLKAWLESIQLMRNIRFDRLYLTHFGAVDDVKPHLIELKARLLNWVNWIKPLIDSNLDQKTITNRFEKYVVAQLEAADTPPQLIEHYKNANPLWMNVAGLLRYWKKKG